MANKKASASARRTMKALRGNPLKLAGVTPERLQAASAAAAQRKQAPKPATIDVGNEQQQLPSPRPAEEQAVVFAPVPAAHEAVQPVVLPAAEAAAGHDGSKAEIKSSAITTQLSSVASFTLGVELGSTTPSLSSHDSLDASAHDVTQDLSEPSSPVEPTTTMYDLQQPALLQEPLNEEACGAEDTTPNERHAVAQQAGLPEAGVQEEIAPSAAAAPTKQVQQRDLPLKKRGCTRRAGGGQYNHVNRSRHYEYTPRPLPNQSQSPGYVGGFWYWQPDTLVYMHNGCTFYSQPGWYFAGRPAW